MNAAGIVRNWHNKQPSIPGAMKKSSSTNRQSTSGTSKSSRVSRLTGRPMGGGSSSTKPTRRIKVDLRGHLGSSYTPEEDDDESDESNEAIPQNGMGGDGQTVNSSEIPDFLKEEIAQAHGVRGGEHPDAAINRFAEEKGQLGSGLRRRRAEAAMGSKFSADLVLTIFALTAVAYGGGCLIISAKEIAMRTFQSADVLDLQEPSLMERFDPRRTLGFLFLMVGYNLWSAKSYADAVSRRNAVILFLPCALEMSITSSFYYMTENNFSLNYFEILWQYVTMFGGMASTTAGFYFVLLQPKVYWQSPRMMVLKRFIRREQINSIS